jgi:uncharacterized membrane protein (DUF485 family)
MQPNDAAPSPPPVERWRARLAWLLPLGTTLACIGFFVAVALRAPWLAAPAFGPSLSRATVVAGVILLAMVAAVVVYAALAERADRARRDDGRR